MTMDSNNFNWVEFYHFANSLDGWCTVPKEVIYRVAVSRYYYAAYKCLMKYAMKRCQYVPKKNSEDHGDLTYHLSSYGDRDPERLNASDRLRRLREYRKQCDYEDDVQNIDAVFEASKKNSEKILKFTGDVN